MNSKLFSILLLLTFMVPQNLKAGPFDGDLDDLEWLSRQEFLRKLQNPRAKPKEVAAPRTIRNPTYGSWGEVASSDVDGILKYIDNPNVRDEFVQNVRRLKPSTIRGSSDIRLMIVMAALSAGVSMVAINKAFANDSSTTIGETKVASKLSDSILLNDVKKLLDENSSQEFEKALAGTQK